VGVVLKKHNEEAYEKAEEMFQTEDRVAVIHPTGTGKTYISLKFIENTQGKTIYVAPTTTILNQVKETIENARINREITEEEYARYQEVTFVTYARLMELSKVESGYENIILDEMHRCGAPEWGKGVERLTQSSKGAKILGLTATPKRAVDNKDMAWELFGNNIASEMTLEQAVARGIIQAPVYISAMYSLEKAVLEAEHKVEKIEDEEKKKELEELITKVKRNLEKAEGMDDILAKYANKPDGKYIVFCSDIKDMHKKMKEAEKWFSKTGEVRLYEVSYKKSDELNEDTIKRFREEGDKINLLFSVDKLNEGIHIDGIDGVIMLRTTSSPIVYMQQLGRALSAGNEGTPLIFDFVNNLENSNYRELEEFVQKIEQIRREEGIDREEEIGTIEIIKLQREVGEVLEQINEKLKRTTYLERAKQIKAWMEKRGTTKPPRQLCEDKEEKSLGKDLKDIRKILITPYLELQTEEEKEKYRKSHPELEEVMQIVKEIDENNIHPYLANAKKIKAWMKERGTTKPPRSSSKDEEEKKLGNDLGSIRRILIKPFLELQTEEKREEYRKKYPYIEEVMQIIQEIDENNIHPNLANAREIKKWMEERGRTKPPTSASKDVEEKKLGAFLSRIRRELITPYLELQIEEEREEYRKKYPYVEEIVQIIQEIDENNIPIKLKQAREIKEWMEESGRTKPPSSSSKDEEEKKLGQNLSEIRYRLITPYLDLKTEEEKETYRQKHPEIEEVMQTIQEIDKNNIHPYLANAREVKKWMEERGTTKPPSSSSKDEKEKRLGNAISNIRSFLITPYLELQTEEEREEYRKKYPYVEEIVQIIQEIDENNIPIKLKQVREVKKWMEERGTTKPPSAKSRDKEEKEFGARLKYIRRELIKQYLELQTEVEKEAYRQAHPELEEVMQIVSDISMNSKNKQTRELAMLIKQDLALRQKVEEARKLEKAYEGQLEKATQKQGEQI